MLEGPGGPAPTLPCPVGWLPCGGDEVRERVVAQVDRGRVCREGRAGEAERPFPELIPGMLEDTSFVFGT